MIRRFRVPILPMILLLGITAFGQPTQPLQTESERHFFRSLFMRLSDPSRLNVDAIKRTDALLIEELSLDTNELALLKSVASEFGQKLQELRGIELRALQTQNGRSRADTFAAVNAQLDQAVGSAASRILASVRPTTAARLRTPGRIVGEAIAKSNGRW